MPKMMRDRKHFARCRVHGQTCGVVEEIRRSMERSDDKRDSKKEINSQLEDYDVR